MMKKESLAFQFYIIIVLNKGSMSQ